jgi:predicted TIM-barrel fold metal-dependent hydrolase
MIGGFPVTDLHIHIQPWEMLLPAVKARMEANRTDLAEIRAMMESPAALLRFLDGVGIERVALINYPSPDLMGFPNEVNDWCARYCAAAPDRLIAFGSVHPRFVADAAAETKRILDLGIRGLKVHPPHQRFSPNDYRTGGPGAAIGDVYRVAEERRVPLMIHTGTSVFPGARNVFADPMPADDVAVDFPKLPLILAHAGRPLHGETAFFLARRHPSVWLDLSGIPPKKLLEYVPRLPEVASRSLWGTDWPSPGVADMRRNVEHFLELGLPPETVRAVLHENSVRLFPAA